MANLIILFKRNKVSKPDFILYLSHTKSVKPLFSRALQESANLKHIKNYSSFINSSWFYRLKVILFVFYVYRHLTSKNAKGITGGLTDFRERTCSRKEIRAIHR